jgi:small subunit ribosomal protein S11
MGKKRIATKKGSTMDGSLKSRALSKLPRRKLSQGVLYVESTYNNTRVTLTDTQGNVVMTSSSGAIGFKGAKKGTPFAAAKVGEIIGEKAKMVGLNEASVIVKGAGAGRESAIRGFNSKGVDVTTIEDRTPVPHNGPRPPRPRKV